MESDLASELKQKKQKIKELSASIEIYAMKPVTREIKAKEQELKDRLSYRLAELELEGMKIKIKVMSELVDILHASSKRIDVLTYR